MYIYSGFARIHDDEAEVEHGATFCRPHSGCDDRVTSSALVAFRPILAAA
jgi:hypothetical protein